MISVCSRLRKDANITQDKLSKILNKSIITIKRWERGEREPSFSDISKAVKFYNLDILRYLIDENDAAEMCDRGFGKFVRYLEQGIFIEHVLLQAFVSKDWKLAKDIHESDLVNTMANCIWSHVTSSDRPLDFWGKSPDEAASLAYSFYERDNWKGLLEQEVISNVSRKFSTTFQEEKKSIPSSSS